MNANSSPPQGRKALVSTLVALALGTTAATLLLTQRPAENTGKAGPSASATIQTDTIAAPPQDLDRALADVNQKMAELASQLSALKRARASGSAPAAAAANDSRQDAESSGLTREELMQRADEQAEAQAAQVEQAVAGERLDPAWAPGAEQSIRGLFQEKDLQGLRLVDARCRATLCRIEMARNDAAQGADFEASFRKLLIRTPWQGQGFARVHDPFSASPTAVLFLAREGAALPLSAP
jgi:hypothetical protein